MGPSCWHSGAIPDPSKEGKGRTTSTERRAAIAEDPVGMQGRGSRPGHPPKHKASRGREEPGQVWALNQIQESISVPGRVGRPGRDRPRHGLLPGSPAPHAMPSLPCHGAVCSRRGLFTPVLYPRRALWPPSSPCCHQDHASAPSEPLESAEVGSVPSSDLGPFPL